MIMYNVDDVLTARRSDARTTNNQFYTESVGGMTREKELINALLDIRDSSESGSYEMATVDHVMGKLGYTPWDGKRC